MKKIGQIGFLDNPMLGNVYFASHDNAENLYFGSRAGNWLSI